jgi:hypothetical protein
MKQSWHSNMAVVLVVAPCVVWEKFTDISEVLAAFVIIALIMEAANTSETSVVFYRTTRRDNPEDSHLHTRRCENLKSHSKLVLFSSTPLVRLSELSELLCLLATVKISLL